MSQTIQASFGLDISPLQAGANKAQGVMQKTMENIQASVGGASAKLAGLFGAGALVGGARSLGNFASEIKDLSDTINLSTDAFQRNSFAVTQSGGTQEAYVKTMIGVQQGMQKVKEGNQEVIRTFDRLGISVARINDSDPEQVLMLIADAMHASGGSGEVFAAVADLIGVKVATKMVPSLKDGSKAFEELAYSASIASKESISDAEQMQDSWDSLWRSIKTGALEATHALIEFVNEEQVYKEMAALSAFDKSWKPQPFPGSALGPSMEEGKAVAGTGGMNDFPEWTGRTEEQMALDESRQKTMQAVAELAQKIAETNLASARDGMTDAQQIQSLLQERAAVVARAAAFEADIFHLHQQESAELRLQEASINRRVRTLQRAEAERHVGPMLGPSWDELHGTVPGGARTSQGYDYAHGFQTASLGSSLNLGGLRLGGLSTGHLGPVGGHIRAGRAHAGADTHLIAIKKAAEETRNIMRDTWSK